MIKILLDKTILDQIAEIERLRKQCGAVKLPVSLSLALRKNSRKKSSYASNRIEGNPLTEAEASEAIESSKRHYLKPEQEIRNYYAALVFLQAARESGTPFSRELILDVQKRVVAGESREKIGIRGPMPPGVLFAVYDEKTGCPDISLANAVSDLTSALTHLSFKERRFFDYLMRKKIDEFTPIEMAKAMKVTNRTVINWSVALAKNGLLEPQLVQKRIRSYRVVRWR